MQPVFSPKSVTVKSDTDKHVFGAIRQVAKAESPGRVLTPTSVIVASDAKSNVMIEENKAVGEGDKQAVGG